MMREECSFTSPFIEQSLFGRSWLARVSANQFRRIFRANISHPRNEMNTGPEETSEENPEKKEKLSESPKELSAVHGTD
jgi:hypothetical protein